MPKKPTVRVMYRQYRKTGEAVAVMPLESATPDGQFAAIFTLATGFISADPQTVVKNTIPATSINEKMLQREIEKEGFLTEKLKKIPNDAVGARKIAPTAYRKFPRLKNQLR